MLEAAVREKAELVERFLNRHFTVQRAEELVSRQEMDGLKFSGGRKSVHAGIVQLLDSVRYSALGGGKRFRPALAMMTSEALGFSAERVMPWAAAVECIHTYSLIHDDLPAMDNDDLRRGFPTNHKVYGDSIAILAGDALLTEAFRLIAVHYRQEPVVANQLVMLLSEASGAYGMVGGQAIDLTSKREEISLSDLEQMHRLKTGALIRVAAVGAAILSFADERKMRETSRFAANLGLAFQVKDDLLDHSPEKPEAGSYPAIVGVEKSITFLKELTEDCLEAIQSWPFTAEPMRELVRFNFVRDR